MKDCVLYDRKCIGCNECDYCDLDKEKICDNCCKCIETKNGYNAVIIDEIVVSGKEEKD